MRISSAILLFLATVSALQAQEFDTRSLENSLYATWGYNRTHYRPSDINFKGEGYDFTLFDVIARDDPEEFLPRVYLNPQKFTVPQFNFRAGYYFNENTSVSLGWDHMKYIMRVPQTVPIEGYISSDFSEIYNGSFSNQSIQIVPGFLQYEHTDGLNFVRLGIEKYAELWRNPKGTLAVKLYLGLNTGVMIPWTDTRINGQRYRNRLHFSGWAFSGTGGFRLKFKNTFFLQFQNQQGFMTMSDILIENDGPGRAAQDIWFNESSICIGADIPIYLSRED